MQSSTSADPLSQAGTNSTTAPGWLSSAASRAGVSRTALAWTAVVVLAGLALWALWSVLPPFAGGIMVAYVLRPACRRLENLGLGRTAAAGVLVGGFFALLVLGCVFLVPFLWSQLTDLVASLPSMSVRTTALLHEHWANIQSRLDPGTLERAEAVTSGYAQSVAATMAAMLRNLALRGIALLDLVFFLVLAPVVGFYALSEWDHWVGWIDANLPRRWVGSVRLHASAIDAVLGAWLRWESTVCLVLAIYYGVGLELCGLRFGLLIGILTGLFAFVPHAGYLAGLAFALVAAAFTYHGWHGWAAVGLVFLLGQFLDAWVLTPRLVGRRVGLHDVGVLFALMAAGHLLGFGGVILAVPGAAVVGVMARSLLNRYRQSSLYLGHAPLVSEPAPGPAPAPIQVLDQDRGGPMLV